MKLTELLACIPIKHMKGTGETEIWGITKDSRDAGPGYIFFATGSSKPFLHNAVERGASVVVSDEMLAGDFPCMVVVDDVRVVMARMAARFYGFPSRDLAVTGITGTNGKTTVSYLIESIIGATGKKAGVIGTISCRYGSHLLKKPNTTPESVDIQSLLRAMKKEGVEHAVMEVSSHALDQGRVEDIDFDRAIFTNLTHDHLDYHGDFAHYRQAKQRLFSHCLVKSRKERKYAIVNLDDPCVSRFVQGPPIETLTYSVEKDADAHLISMKEDIRGLLLQLSLKGRAVEVSTSLVGSFNVSNILASLLFGHSADIPLDIIKKGVESLHGVPGRLERAGTNTPFHAFVDYAHTPDALRKTLETLNRVRKGRLIVVFGCGGDRDRTKRAVMGRIASDLADFSFITSDNPRSEEPGEIINQIKSGFTGNSFRAIENRREAIAEAVRMARENDVVLVAGKGHEDYQIIGTMVHRFSDREVIEECIDVAC
jgi:UDP-N-acetylmuramoyl-L-alanyl-D-glutamate--2,6-diaminopimelate ligase